MGGQGERLRVGRRAAGESPPQLPLSDLLPSFGRRTELGRESTVLPASIYRGVEACERVAGAGSFWAPTEPARFPPKLTAALGLGGEDMLSPLRPAVASPPGSFLPRSLRTSLNPL